MFIKVRFLTLFFLGLMGMLLTVPSLPSSASTSAPLVPPTDCPIHENSDGRLFLEPWQVLSTLENPQKWGAYTNQLSLGGGGVNLGDWQSVPLANGWSVAGNTLLQSNATSNQLNLLYESSAHIADGVVETCLHLPNLTGTSLFPHGIALRLQHNSASNVMSGVAIGFLDTNTLAMGQVVNDQASLLGNPKAVSFHASDWVRIKYVLRFAT